MWETIGKLFGIGSALVKTGASIYQAKTARKAARRQAEYERRSAGLQAEQRRRDMRRRIGVQRANFAAQGIRLDGSAGLLVDETERLGLQDIGNIRSMGEMRASMARKRGRAAAIGGGLSAAGSLLGGGFDFYQTFPDAF